MGTTPNYSWPYPELTDRPDGAAQIKALANSVDTTLKAQISPSDTSFTPVVTGMTLGNGAISGNYYKVGSLCYLNFSITAAAAAPTTAFVASQQVTVTTPVPNRNHSAFGYCRFTGSSPWKWGIIETYGTSGLKIWGIRPSDLGFVNPDVAWGTAVWPVSTSVFGQIVCPC